MKKKVLQSLKHNQHKLILVKMSANAVVAQTSRVEELSQKSTATGQVELQSNGAPAQSSASAHQAPMERRGPPYSKLERDAQIDVFVDEGKSILKKVWQVKTLRTLARVGSTVLIVAGVVAIALAALFIWPAAVAWRESNALVRYESASSASGERKRPQVDTARVMAILTVVLGALGTLAALGSLVVGLAALSLGFLLSFAMLAVGAVAAHRLNAYMSSKEDVAKEMKDAGRFSRASNILWITTMVLGLIVPGLAGLVLGSIIKRNI